MLKNRLIFTLLLQDETYMLSRNFSLQQAGDLGWIKDFYDFNAISFSIDELVVLNVDRDIRDMKSFSNNLIKLNKNCFMPIAAGGGINSLDDAFMLLDSGADKLVINSAIIANPKLVRELVKTFGSQCIIASIDYKKVGDSSEVYIMNGKNNTNLTVQKVARMAQEIGVGELYITSMDRDGTGQGFDYDTLKQLVSENRVPVIASGGAGKFEHLVEAITYAGVSAVSTANLFNFLGEGLTDARKHMQENHIELAKWKFGNY